MKSAGSKLYWLGFDLGGTKIMANLIDPNFKIMASLRRKTRGADSSDAILSRIIKLIKELLAQEKISTEQLAGIGVGSAGPLDLNRGVILETPNLSWKNVPLKDALEEAFHCSVLVANDVDAGTYGEYRFGAARGARCAVGVFLGTGIGAGCVYEDRLLRGRVGSCMEIGHMQMQLDGPQCGCGQNGCLEALASRLAIAAEAAAAAYRGKAPHILKVAGTDIAMIRSGTLADAIQAGDAVVEGIVRKASRHVGLAIANVVNLLAPDIVVLGGGLVQAMPELILAEAKAEIVRRAMPGFTASLKVLVAELGDSATAMGAAALVAQIVSSGERR